MVALLIPALLVWGCQRLGTSAAITVLEPAQTGVLETSSRFVLEVICTNVLLLPEYSLRDRFRLEEPLPHDWQCQVTFLVNRVVKGPFHETILPVDSFPFLTESQSRQLGDSRASGGLTNGMPLRIGFDGYGSGRFRNLRIGIPSAGATPDPSGERGGP